MGQPYIGEIRMFGGNFAPVGWAFCDGQLIAISENDTLFNLIGTTYGGDGQETFALPDLRGRLPIHQGQSSSGTNYQIGEAAGVESVTLTTQQLPSHSHNLVVSSNNATKDAAKDNVLAQTPSYTPYINANPNADLAPNSMTPVGGSQPHENLMPYLCVNFIIALYGVFPSQN
jgi:microcystin-dependent protein